MDWSLATWWWIAAGVLVAAELASGTFYLLMLALGAGAGGSAGLGNRDRRQGEHPGNRDGDNGFCFHGKSPVRW